MPRGQDRIRRQISGEDFIREGVYMLVRDAHEYRAMPEIHAAILNPPYRKINTDSPERHLLRRVGMETSNLYAPSSPWPPSCLSPEAN